MQTATILRVSKKGIDIEKIEMSEERFLLEAILKAGLTDNLIIGKTQEILRKLLLKLPVGSLKKAEICRGLIAIEIACSFLNTSLDKVKLMAQVSITPKIYQEGLIKCKQVLKVQRDSDVTQKLAVHFGVHLKCLVQDTLGQYKINYIDKLHPNQRALVDINSAVCQAAAFYVVGVKSKVSLLQNTTTGCKTCLILLFFIAHNRFIQVSYQQIFT